MQAIVAAQLGVEGDCCDAALTSGDWMALDLREDLHLGSVLGNPRGADEHTSQRPTLDSLHLQIGLKAAQLTPEGVALGKHVHDAQVLAVEHDQTSTRAENGHTTRSQLPQGCGQALALHSERHRGGLPTGDHETVQAIDVGGHTYLSHVCAQSRKHARMRLEIALQGEDADQRRYYQPR